MMAIKFSNVTFCFCKVNLFSPCRILYIQDVKYVFVFKRSQLEFSSQMLILLKAPRGLVYKARRSAGPAILRLRLLSLLSLLTAISCTSVHGFSSIAFGGFPKPQDRSTRQCSLLEIAGRIGHPKREVFENVSAVAATQWPLQSVCDHPEWGDTLWEMCVGNAIVQEPQNSIMLMVTPYMHMRRSARTHFSLFLLFAFQKTLLNLDLKGDPG